MDNRKDLSQVLTQLTTYSLSFPTCLSHPRKCAPSLLNSPSAAPLPFQGFSNRPDRKSQSVVAVVYHLWESIPNNSLTQRTSHGPDNPLLQSRSKLTRYTNQKGCGNRLQNGEMVVSRITECMSEMVMESLTG
jgi:hypothetical protein